MCGLWFIFSTGFFTALKQSLAGEHYPSVFNNPFGAVAFVGCRKKTAKDNRVKKRTRRKDRCGFF
ncbi:MAG TPA: hypothetical protein DCR43_03295 [Bacteroidales bacterium]|nr:MAG: hypothetical protein A2X11_00055 [Bacteroidetes bacterium GWE2_42_24]HAQ64868.1 hypothetical protein [Bacteroidales bacterium]